uniref:F-box domain-containing protein n=1 Tax=Meloidogyne incognita TaxID=6306 RepID=A0A914MZG2_MELIC
MEQIPRLSDDVLYIISEKLLFKKFCRHVDLRITNGYTLFMYHSAKNMRALLSHFSKMKRLNISNYGNDDSENNIFINFGRDDKPSNFYYISKNLFSDLFEAGLLNITSIRINNILGSLPKIDFSATNKNIHKYLVNLEEGLSDSPISSSLNISKIIINEPAETLKNHLITLLSMNIENLEILCSDNGNMFECDAKTFELVLLERPSVPMERSKKITNKCNIEINSNSSTNFLNNLMNYIQFLLLCCPNLEFIEFVFTCDSDLKTDFFGDSGSYESISSDDSFSFNSISLKKFLLNLESIIISLIEHLKNLNTGGKDLKIRVEFSSTFDENNFCEIDTDSNLFNLGKPFEIKKDNDDLLEDDEEYSAYYGRNIEIVDSVGRQHECLFKIFKEQDDYLDYDDSIYYSGDSDNRSISGFS